MKIIPRTKLPKADYCPAAECRLDFDQAAERLRASPKRGTFRDGLPFPNRYREICMRLTTGRGATLTQTEMRQGVVEIGLEIRNDEFFHEEDLLEVMDVLGIGVEYVKRIENDFTWLPAGKTGSEKWLSLSEQRCPILKTRVCEWCTDFASVVLQTGAMIWMVRSIDVPLRKV
jgi:hypothetical protein